MASRSAFFSGSSQLLHTQRHALQLQCNQQARSHGLDDHLVQQSTTFWHSQSGSSTATAALQEHCHNTFADLYSRAILPACVYTTPLAMSQAPDTT